MEHLFPQFKAEEAFVVERLDQDQNATLANLLGTIVEHLESGGETRRTALRGDAPLPPRRSGRRARG